MARVECVTDQVRCSQSSGGLVKADGEGDESEEYFDGTRRVMGELLSVDILVVDVQGLLSGCLWLVIVLIFYTRKLN